MKTSAYRYGSSLASLVVLGCLAAALPAKAVVLIDEDFQEYTNLPAAPASPWVVSNGGGTTPAPSTVTVVEQTVNSTTSNWMLVGNNATNEPTGNPGVRAMFTQDTGILNISFSFMIPANYGNNSQLQFNMGNLSYTPQTGLVWKPALTLYLGANYQASTSAAGYRTSGGSRVNFGGTFVAGQVFTMNLLNINQALGTYDISWSTSGGTSGLLEDIALTASITETWNYISFGENSGVISTSQLYMDNIVVEAIPEPTTLGALALGGMLLMVVFPRRRSDAKGTLA